MPHFNPLLKPRLEELELEIRSKSNYKKSWHQIVRLFFWFASLLGANYKNYITIVGDTIYVPDHLEEISDSTLLHEFVHREDALANGWWFYISYVCFRKWRAHWEYRGYTQNMLHRYKKTGKIDLDTIDWIADQFTSYKYLWMDRNPRPKLMAIKAAIENGEIT